VVEKLDDLAVGEDVSTTSARDCQHWSDFYRELSSFEQTIRRLKRQVRDLSGESRADAVRLVLPELIADSENFERRFEFWAARLAGLS
jgi:hypothetical protein